MEPASDDELRELKDIYARWENTPIPEDIRHFLEIEQKTLRYNQERFMATAADVGMLSRERAQSTIESFNEALHYSILGSLFIGMELAARTRFDSGTKPSDDVITLRLDFEEYGVIDACLYAVKNFIYRKPDITKTSLSRYEEFALRRIDEVQRIVGVQAESAPVFPKKETDEGMGTSLAFSQMLASVLVEVDRALFRDALEQAKRLLGRSND
jgi:hypothetical protein